MEEWWKDRYRRPSLAGVEPASIAQYSTLRRTRAPDSSGSSRRGHESTVPSFAPSPAELFDRGQRSAGGRKSSSRREGSARSSGGSAFFSHTFCCRPEFHPFFSHSVFLTPSGVAVKARWRAKKSSSFTPRRQSLGNGRASASSSGTPKRDSSWGALALVGVSFFNCSIIFSIEILISASPVESLRF